MGKRLRKRPTLINCSAESGFEWQLRESCERIRKIELLSQERAKKCKQRGAGVLRVKPRHQRQMTQGVTEMWR